jgi:hypothetical protein
MQSFFGGVIVSRTSGADALWKLEYDNLRARLTFSTERPGYGSIESSPDNSIINGAWTHIVLVVDGPAGTASVYINGNKAMDATFWATDFDGDAGLAWGGVFNNANAASFIGQLDECRFWEGIRTEAQIQAAMGQRLDPLDRSGLLGYWTFCNGFNDETPYRHELLLRGNPLLQQSYSLPASLDCTEQRDSNFVNLVVPVGGENAVTVNYESIQMGDFTSLAGSGFSYARLWLPTGLNRIETSDVRGLGASSYGFAYHDAYTTYTGFRVSGGTQSVAGPALPDDVELHAPWPQPASGSVRVRYTIGRTMTVRIILSDVNGRILQVIDNGVREAGTHEVEFHGSDLTSGTYILQMHAQGKRLQRRVVLLR